MDYRNIEGHAGINLRVATAGDPSNPAILLVHGWMQAAASWRHQFAGLSDRFYIVAPDLRGHAGSDKPVGEEFYHDGEIWAADIAAVIGAFDLKNPVLVGWSMGGYVVQDYLVHHGEDAIAGTVLVGTGVTKGALLPAAATAARAADTDVTSPDLVSEDDDLRQRATAAFINACAATPLAGEDFEEALAFNMACPRDARIASRGRPFDYRPVMSQLSKPVLVVWGDHERLSHRSMFDQTMECIPTARASIFEGAGHMPFFEDPQRFNAELAQFTTALQA